ncbi:MAG: ATP-binding protein [Candidatus Gastranaerophilales bacterium]|nr:ATP-binding protein [Candidatus Gastranaerophilales bacterium]
MSINDKLIKTLASASQMLNASYDPNKTFEMVFLNAKNIFQYDNAVILFVENDRLIVKKQDGFNFDKNKTFEIKNSDNLKNSIYGNVNDFFISEFIKEFRQKSSFIIAPLALRDNIFGIICFFRNEENYFDEIDLEIIKTFSTAASYTIKDAEITQIFKNQLKILKKNIDEKNEAYEIIKEQNEKIKETDRIKNEFLANISHELRTPMNAIIGFSEALKLKIFGELNEKQEDYVNDIHTSGIHLLGMINDILDLAKLEAKKIELCKTDFSVFQSINEAIGITRPLAEKKNITIKLNCEDKNAQIHADRKKFQQILYNLISNAIKFTDDNGKIEVNYKISGNNIRIYVKDNGIGIDEKYHDKIFAKFQQVDNSLTRKYSSTGLGLTITKELVELHGGKIWIESKQNEGSKFIFELTTGEINE